MSSSSPPSSSASPSAKADKVRLIGVGGVRHVSEASFDFLHTEMVHYFARQISVQDSSLPMEAQASKLHGKLEALGFSVGQRLAERYTKDLHFLSSELDVIKFLCKDFWLHAFNKQIDKLQTNHRGVYVLHDQHCRMLQHVHPLQGMTSREVEEQSRVLLAFSCGLVRGALSNLGLTATVRADIIKGAACHFTITDLDRVRRAEEHEHKQHSADHQQHSHAPPEQRTT